jgi:hypothetical protein
MKGFSKRVIIENLDGRVLKKGDYREYKKKEKRK